MRAPSLSGFQLTKRNRRKNLNTDTPTTQVSSVQNKFLEINDLNLKSANRNSLKGKAPNMEERFLSAAAMLVVFFSSLRHRKVKTLHEVALSAFEQTAYKTLSPVPLEPHLRFF